MYFKAFIEKHGKQASEEIIDIMLIKESLPHGDEFRQWLIKHGIIKQTTKIINTNGFTSKNSGYRWNGEWTRCEDGDKRYVMRVVNGRAQYIVNTEFFQSDIPNIKRYLETL